MASAVNIDGNDFGLFDNNPSPISFDAADRYSLAGQNASTLSQAYPPIPMDVILRSATISLFSINLGGSVRPPKRPEIGFAYPRRLT